MVKLRFGPRVKKARVRLGISQGELGRKLDPQVSHATISLWENENSFPSEEQKAQVNWILGQTSQVDTRNSAEALDDEIVESPSAIGAWLTKARLSKDFSVPELAARSDLSAASIYNIESGKSQSP